MKKCDCPLNSVASILGRKWVIIILRDLFLGKTQFKEFLAANKDLSNKVLSQKLKEMETEGLIKRKVIDKPLGVKYELTKDGKKLRPVLREMVKYGKSYCTSDKNYNKLLEKL